MPLAPWPPEQPIPLVCELTDVLRILRMSRQTFNRREQRGELGRLVELDRIGKKRRFSGASVKGMLGGRWSRGLRRVG